MAVNRSPQLTHATRFVLLSIVATVVLVPWNIRASSLAAAGEDVPPASRPLPADRVLPPVGRSTGEDVRVTAFGKGGGPRFDFKGELAEDARAIRGLTLRVKVAGEEGEASPFGIEFGGAHGGSGVPSRDLRFAVLVEVGEESLSGLEGISGSVAYYTAPPANAADPRPDMVLADMGSTLLRDGAAVVYDVSRQQPIESPDAHRKFMEEFDKDFGKFVAAWQATLEATDADPAATDDFEIPRVPVEESKVSLQFKHSSEGSRFELFYRLSSSAVLGRIVLLQGEPETSVDRLLAASSTNPSIVLLDRRMFVPLESGVGFHANLTSIEGSAVEKRIQDQAPIRVVLGFVKGAELRTASFSHAMPGAAPPPLKDSGGRLVLNGETVELKHAVAYRAEIFSEEVVGVTLTQRKATDEQIQSSEFPGAGLELLFRPDGKLVYVSAKSRSEERWPHAGLTARTEFRQHGGGVTGRAVLDDPDGGLSFDVRFAERIIGGQAR